MQQLNKDIESGGHYRPLAEGMQKDKPTESDTDHFLTHPTTQQKKPIRSTKKRADIQASFKAKTDRPVPAGCVWAICVGAEVVSL
ncbi:uncharacterized ACR, YagE family COG1723 domain-containing protein, putative [Eimeria maxima]|uniref:Uncharacterized ACR, YagE family COG1723 domain-containing protein, putative n=1 Tax=Eimeria maxima TaxID=5804 RepID=U6MG09_EIMMA|nr:uncharacterized ACR, YagE family COG1723 domain-containing protein, putative [Eimeria maxima]CDJ60565.1 uncharacterized ACR, YagE family COG1723 domain-containing protein, putative [Eimeria maxima]